MKTPGIWTRLRLGFGLLLAIVVIICSCLFFLYPAAIIIRLLADTELKETGMPSLVPEWFEATSARHAQWAQHYLDSEYAKTLHHSEVAPTEWPMFGAVFYLVTAEELASRGMINPESPAIHSAIDLSATIVASETTAEWVRQKWGEQYLAEENIFYRMLLLMGLSSYEKLARDGRYNELLTRQRDLLSREIDEAPWHLRDDYPGECYPSDILWAVAAIQRTNQALGDRDTELPEKLMTAFDQDPVAVEGLPAFQMHSRKGWVLQDPRGRGNSGLLLFAAELDPQIARQWYAHHEEQFWKENRWAVGFREHPNDSTTDFMDVDSGPVLFDFGTVASALGIGAAHSVGRLDHVVPLTLEAVACSWPTPFGFLVPSIMGKLGADSRSLGEVALLFSMSRPNQTDGIIPYRGEVPNMVWGMLFFYTGAGLLFIWLEIRAIRKFFRALRDLR